MSERSEPSDDRWSDDEPLEVDLSQSAREFFARFAWDGVEVDPQCTPARAFLAFL